MRCALGEERRTSCSSARWPSITSTTSEWSRSRTWRRRRSRCSRGRTAPLHRRCRPPGRRRRLRLQALDRPPARRRRGSRSSSSRRRWDADAVLALDAASRAGRERAGRSGAAHRRGRDRSRASRSRRLFGVCLGHQLLGLALGSGRSSCRSATAAQTTRCAFAIRSASSSRCRTTASRSRRRTRRGQPRLAERRDGGGLEGDGFFSLQFHPEAAPGPLDALPFFDRIARDAVPKRTDLRSDPDRRLRADPDRPGLRVRLLRARRPAGSCAPRGTASCSSTRTRRRS